MMRTILAFSLLHIPAQLFFTAKLFRQIIRFIWKGV
jgi:hypothetical protein